MKKIQVAVLGSSKVICTKKAYAYAEKAGEELAKRDCVVITGGGLGVMEAAMKGAKKYGGTTLAIIPWEDKSRVNDYADYVVATGIGWSRNSINLNSCDGAIAVGGGAGTLNEVTYAYMQSKPTVCVTPSGGMAKEISDTYFDIRKTQKIYGADSAEEAVELLLKLIKNQTKQQTAHDLEMLEHEKHQNWKLRVNPKVKKKPAKRESASERNMKQRKKEERR
ncbi:TIGR00725 family protein [Candidatus Woesearchaeota archaeon]|nr:TIGR00725 family protein [Candidatus Woesearchaeota archaeon]